MATETMSRFPLERLQGATGKLQLDDSEYTVVYFYPKDDTPGCTIEANEFQRLKPEFDRRRIRILGVSVDDARSHQAFCDKFSLAFELATDAGGEVGRSLDIMKGDLHRRVTFVLDHGGNVALSYPEVKPAGHAQQILDDIEGLKARIRPE